MGKKAKKSKDKKGGGNLAAVREAILGYHLEARKKLTDELEAEVSELQKLNERYKERNLLLKQEHFENFQTLLKKAKAQEMEIEQNQMYNSTHVEQALKSKWELVIREDAITEALMKEIRKVEEKCKEAEEKLRILEEIRKNGGEAELLKIARMESELLDMKNSFEYMRDSIQTQCDKELSKIQAKTKIQMSEQTDLASEKAIDQLDPNSLQEVFENKWLREEVEIHRVEQRKMQIEVGELEQKNLKIISELLDCQESDLIKQTNFCAHTVFDETASVLKGDLIMDLNKMSIYQTECPDSDDEGLKCHCKTMPTRAKEDIFGPSADCDGGIESQVIANQDESISLDEDEDFLFLGPMEVRLLHVTGESKAIHSPTNSSIKLAEKATEKQSPTEITSRAKWFGKKTACRALTKKKVGKHSSKACL